ncbi:MAG TPA: PP2C family serine/threonine-protein phosphatase [Longimicrobium sp.]|nr:PP2C family serine/threonine-protein phosphatase [Longimicrobium sp.]
MKATWEVAGATDVGRVRPHNEDSFLVDAPRGVFLVADGMGGHAAGEIASAIASEAVGAALRQGVDGGLGAADLGVVMRESIHQAHMSILNYSATKPETRGMGTTMTALVICDDGAFRVGHIGDSRCYVLRDGELEQVSRDHTWVQREVDEGRLTPMGARRHRLAHVLSRALGADSLDEPDVYAGTLLPGDLVLLATDGLTGMLTDRLLRRILTREAELHELVADLIVGANERGGRDNITAVLVKVRAAD